MCLIQYLSLRDWLFSLSKRYSRFIHVAACVRISFLFETDIPLYVYITFCLFIHVLMDTWVASTFWQLWIMLLWTWMYQYVVEFCFKLFWVYTQNWNCWIIIFWRTSRLFPIVSAPFYIPTKSAQEFQFIHILANTCYFVYVFCFYSSYLNGFEVYLIVVLICISLIISAVEHCFM